ncbi:translocation/assembly module TamB domain-containing protein [Altererythrobacter sp. Z27]|uniref:translocation/assembly module TamB domain-containing protein n=1 Tax=Altererythrobacter sp. Z27 TaxID=3461147 RepID=UPI004043F975
MTEEALPDDGPDTPEISRRRRWAKRLGWALAAVFAPLVLAFLVLNSPIGKRFIADQIASYAPASGLKIEIGRIQGDIYREAILHDVVLSDPKGKFLTIPVVELDWRPLSWIPRGLDIRHLVARRGRLERLPELLPGDPDKPILPDFDIRIDRFEIDNLTLVPGLATPDAQRVDLSAHANIRDGLVALEVDGTFGKTDKLELALYAEPDGDRFDLDLDYRAPAGGVVAGLVGAEEGYTARILGDGTWRNWLGHVLVKRGDARLAAFRLTHRAGDFGLIGEAYAADVTSGLLQRALGSRTGVIISGTFEDSEFDGKLSLGSDALTLKGEGGIDLADNRFDDFGLEAALLDPEVFGEGVALSSASMRATLDGGFREFTIVHDITASELMLGEIRTIGLRQEGTGRLDEGTLRIPLKLALGQIETGSEIVDKELISGRIGGELTYGGGRIRANPLQVAFPRLSGQLTLDADPVAGSLRLAGPARLNPTTIDSLGTARADTRLDFALASGKPWTLSGQIDGTLSALSNSTLAGIVGDPISIRTGFAVEAGAPVRFDEFTLASGQLEMAGAAQWSETGFTFDARGAHTTYGEFTLDAAIEEGGPRAVLALASPLPAAGLEDVRLTLAPAGDDYRIDASGNSLLGEFVGILRLAIPERRPATIDVERLRIWQTLVEGRLAFEQGGARGRLELDGGGLSGNVAFAPNSGGQGISAEIAADRATFGGGTPIDLGQARLSLDGTFGKGASRIRGDLSGRGLRYGQLFLGRIAAHAELADGAGKVSASIIGRQVERFSLQLDGDIAPGRIAAIARGNYAGTPISMPRRAVFTRIGDTGWRLAPAQLRVGEGQAGVSGEFGGARTALELKLSKIPLSLGDLVVRDLGLGGTASGIVAYEDQPGRALTADVRVKVEGLTRSGLLLASRPVDLSLVGSLGQNELEAKAVFAVREERLGWMQARITGMAPSGELYERLQRGALSADMRFDGPAEAIWRLAAVDAIDLSGPVAIRARASGTLAEPRVRGTVTSSDLRVRSVLSGTDLRNASVSGDFEGSRLFLRRFAGKAAGGGTITGSGTIDLADMEPGRGPKLDLRAAADKARLVDARGLRATVTGPLRIVSSGNGGTIAGRLEVDQAGWQLGKADETVALPEIATREINLSPEIAPITKPASPWRYLIDARARNGIAVDGMGLDSEWRGDIVLRGTTADPRIGGEAQVVRGTYTFAGTSFELTRGRIDFDVDAPIDPQLDIVAETERDGLNVTVNVRGKALTPEITFASDPALPEEEILARLLFGGSITTLSPTDALQLGAALASLRGGGGMDPINKLRSAIGLDRLRIVGADPVLGRETGVALGENLGRDFYVELITDGRGYSATQLEFRVTSWLSLLGSVSTLGRNSAVVEVSRDY